MVESGSRHEEESTALDLVPTVGSPKVRPRILLSLREEPQTATDLAERLEQPRTTVSHNLSVLANEHLVERTITDEYQLTARGWVVAHGIRTFRDDVTTGLRLQGFFEHVSRADTELELRWLRDSTVTLAKRSNPHAPLRQIRSAFCDQPSITGFLPSHPPIEPDSIDATLDLVIGVDGIEAIEAPDDFAESEWVTRGGVNLGITDRSMPCGALVVEDDGVLLVAFDPRGNVTGVIAAENEKCREWARDRFDHYWEGARRVT